MHAIASGSTDLVGLARALVLDPNLPSHWLANQSGKPSFPKFASPPEGGITAWYTMRMTDLGQDRETDEFSDLELTVRIYEKRDEERVVAWNDCYRQ